MLQTRYHIQLATRRTTISMDTVLSELLAIRLGVTPNSKAAHKKIREWLETTIHDKLGDNPPGHSQVSQWARRSAIEAIAEGKLMDAVWEHRLKEDEDKNNSEHSAHSS